MSLHVSWEQYHVMVERLALRVYESGWQFNQVICIARGGLRVGDVVSRIYDLPLAILSTQDRPRPSIAGRAKVARSIV